LGLGAFINGFGAEGNPTGWTDALGLVGALRPGGHQSLDVAPHENLSPTANRAPGHTNSRADGSVQSHHAIQQEWATRNKIPGYDANKAPCILLPSHSGSPHAKISASQRKRRRECPGYGTSIQDEFRISYGEMIDAGVPTKQARKAMAKNYKYFDSIGAFR